MGTQRAWLLLLAAGLSPVVGIVDATLAIQEHLQHPEWSAPAYVNLINAVPHVLVSGFLGLAYWRLRRRRTESE